MEITYHWEGDYLISDLKLSDATEYHIGKYVTEQLKSDDWLGWLQKMNSIRSREEEIVY